MVTEAAVEAVVAKRHLRKKTKAKNNCSKPAKIKSLPVIINKKIILDTDAKSSRIYRQEAKSARPDGIWPEPEPKCARPSQKEARSDNVRALKKIKLKLFYCFYRSSSTVLANQSRILVLEEMLKDLVAIQQGPTDQGKELAEVKKRLKKLEELRYSESQVTKLVNLLGESKEFNENMFLLVSDRLYDANVRGEIHKKGKFIKIDNFQTRS